jgi:MFS family permease
MCSSLGASYYLKYGKYNMILVMNALIVVGSGLCMIDLMPVIAVGRLLIGIAAGAFSVMCPQFLAELSPVEMKGPIGTMN